MASFNRYRPAKSLQNPYYTTGLLDAAEFSAVFSDAETCDNCPGKCFWESAI
jgi:hypothetical protein